MRRILAFGLVLTLVLAMPGLAARPDAPAQLIVAFDHLVGPADAALLEERGATVLRLVPNADFALVHTARAQAFTEALRGVGGVRYVEPDQELFLEGSAVDLYYLNNQQWGPKAIRADAAWDVVTGSDTIAYAVVDTGVDYTHPDLAANMWVNDDLPDGLDNDGNGYVDDTFGWDCEANDADPLPEHFHGTHVAGITAARKDNGFGIAGVAQVKIMALKTFTTGLNAASAAQCIRYAADNGARVLGMSWLTTPSTVITEALQYAWSKDVVLVKSAGNQGNSGPVTYPGTLPEVIAVSALNSPGNTLASYSSTGAKVELAAPGTGILSTVPGADWGPSTPGFGLASGTSMAQPHAAGVACLILAKNPSLTNQQVRDLLGATADDLGDPGRDPRFGFGRVNASRAVLAA